MTVGTEGTSLGRSRRALAACVATLLAVAGSLAVGIVPAGAIASDRLDSGTVLSSGQQLRSPDNRFTVAMQTDGNLVLYAETTAVWSSASEGNPGAYAAMQTDGNLVVYTAGGQARWSSGSAGHSDAGAIVQDNGEFVVRLGVTATSLWTSGTADVLDPPSWKLQSGWGLERPDALVAEHDDYAAILQEDGNLVVYRAPQTALWSAATYGTAPHLGAALVMGTNGELVVLDEDDDIIWTSGTAGNPGAFAVMQDDGNFVVYSLGGRALWSSGTGGR